MEMPTTGPEHDVLARLVGEWIGAETMSASAWSPGEEKRRSRIRARMLDGFFLISDYEQSAEDRVSFRGHGVYGWDPSEKAYTMYWFDSMGGGGGVAKGQFENNRLRFENSSPMGRHRYTYTFGDAGYRFEMSMSPDGKNWQTLMVGDYSPAK